MYVEGGGLICVQVSQIKEKVEEKEGIPPVQQRLIYGGKQMYVSLSFTFVLPRHLPRHRTLSSARSRI
jgi:hypothetical protein